MKREKITRVRGGDKTPRRNSATATMRSGGGEGRSLSPSTRSTAQGKNRPRLLRKTKMAHGNS